MEWVRTNANMVGILANRFDQVLVDGDTARFKCLTRDLLLFVTDQVRNKGELIYRSLLVSRIENANLTIGDTAAKSRLNVGFVLCGESG